MTYIGRKFVPSHVIRGRMDRQDLRYQHAAAAKVREHAEVQGKEPDQKSWNDLARELECTRYRSPMKRLGQCCEPGCAEVGSVWYGRDQFDGAGLVFLPERWRCDAHAEAYRAEHLTIERT